MSDQLYPDFNASSLDPVPQNRGSIDSRGISQDAKFLQILIEDKAVPKEIKKDFWPFGGDKELALSNFKNSDVNLVLTALDVAWNYKRMSMPDYGLTFDDERNMLMMRIKTFVRAKRSVDANERRLIATQIRQSIYQEGAPSAGGGLGGSLRGIANKITGR